MMFDTIICSDKEDAKNCIDAIGHEYIEDWQFMEDGRIELFLREGWDREDENNSR